MEDIAQYLERQGALEDTKEFLTLCNDFDRFVDSCYTLQTAREEGQLGRPALSVGGLFGPGYLPGVHERQRGIHHPDLAQANRNGNGQRVQHRAHPRSGADEFGQIITDQDEAESQQEVHFVTTLNQDETLVLASIIEREAGRREDYAKVSAVFITALERGMRLESDATTAYPLGIQRMVLTAEELSTVNGYNTYTRDGLPVGPICNPSKAAIQAALYRIRTTSTTAICTSARGILHRRTGFQQDPRGTSGQVDKYRPLWVAYDQQNAQLRAAPTQAPENRRFTP